MFYRLKQDNLNKDKVHVIEIKHGIKVEVREKVLKQLLQEPYIIDNFNLNIKRLNRWWFSVYFEGKDKMFDMPERIENKCKCELCLDQKNIKDLECFCSFCLSKDICNWDSNCLWDK